MTSSDAKAFVYIMTNQRHTVLYIGVTNDLVGRVWQHKQHVQKGFTDRYNVEQLAYYESFSTIEEAILREKYLKGEKRSFKEALISQQNPKWQDLSKDFFD